MVIIRKMKITIIIFKNPIQMFDLLSSPFRYLNMRKKIIALIDHEVVRFHYYFCLFFCD